MEAKLRQLNTMANFIKVTPSVISDEVGLYRVINADYIVSFVRSSTFVTTIKMCVAGEVSELKVKENPEELFEAIKETNFPIEKFIEVLKDSTENIPVKVYGSVTTH